MGRPTAVRNALAAAQFVTAVVGTSVLIDYLGGHQGAAELLERERKTAPLHASEITRLEVLAGMRPAEEAGALGRKWLPSHHPIDGADLAIAATALRTDSRLLTCNVRHFPMFADLHPPY